MKLEGKITILISAEGTVIKIKDSKACVTICEVRLTTEQLSQALSRLAHTDCEVEVFENELNKIGKTHEHEDFVFEIPEQIRYSSNKQQELIDLCVKSLKKHKMSEWIPDGGFASQNTFFEKDGISYARTVIRRWV